MHCLALQESPRPRSQPGWRLGQASALRASSCNACCPNLHRLPLQLSACCYALSLPWGVPHPLLACACVYPPQGLHQRQRPVQRARPRHARVLQLQWQARAAGGAAPAARLPARPCCTGALACLQLLNPNITCLDCRLVQPRHQHLWSDGRHWQQPYRASRSQLEGSEAGAPSGGSRAGARAAELRCAPAAPPHCAAISCCRAHAAPLHPCTAAVALRVQARGPGPDLVLGAA